MLIALLVGVSMGALLQGNHMMRLEEERQLGI